jgi:TPR repeat protein
MPARPTDAVGLLQAGKDLLEKDRTAAMEMIKRSAVEGNLPEAQHTLGFLTLTKTDAESGGEEVDKVAARESVLNELKEMKKTARQEKKGKIKKQRRAGDIQVIRSKASDTSISESSQPSKEDSKEAAMSWFKEAAMQGFADSQVQLVD